MSDEERWQEWLRQLRELAVKFDWPMSDDAGCWRDYYDEEYAPDEALMADMSYADE